MAAGERSEKLRRLRQLRPWELAVSAERDLLVSQRSIQQLSEMSSTVVGGTLVTHFAEVMHEIVAFAIDGGSSCLQSLSLDEVKQSALDVLSVLYSSPVAPVEASEAVFENVDPEVVGSEAALACVAALGRIRVLEGRPVPDSWLAALGSVSAATIRVYTYGPRSNEQTPLERPEGQSRAVMASSAKAFLRERGVVI